MYGTIVFTELSDLVEFLAEFTGKSTAVFTVHRVENRWEMKFEGGN